MDRDQLRSFVEEDYARVVAALTWTCGDRASAEDAVQDALATACQRRERITNVPAWVAKCALNNARSKARRRGAEARALERMAQGSSRLQADIEPPLDDVLVSELRRLPQRQREIVVLHYLLDMSTTDIAVALGVTDGTVKTQLHRARSSLRARLTPDDQSEQEVDRVG